MSKSNKIKICKIITNAEKKLCAITIEYKNVLVNFEVKIDGKNNLYNKWVYYTMTNKHTKGAYGVENYPKDAERCAKEISNILAKISEEFQDDLIKMLKDFSMKIEEVEK